MSASTVPLILCKCLFWITEIVNNKKGIFGFQAYTSYHLDFFLFIYLFSIEYRKVIGFTSNTLHDWLK